MTANGTLRTCSPPPPPPDSICLIELISVYLWIQGTPIPFTVSVLEFCVKIEYGCRCLPIPDCIHEKVTEKKSECL